MSDHNRPPVGPNFNAQFMNLNIGAQPFIPNAQAQPFVPMLHQRPSPGYGSYNYRMQGASGGTGGRYGHSQMGMGMHHQMHPGGGGVGNYRMSAQQHGMGNPFNPHPIPVSAQETDYLPMANGSSSQAESVSTPSMSSSHSRQQQQPHHPPPPHAHILTPPLHSPPSLQPTRPTDAAQDLSPISAAIICRSTMGEATPTQEKTFDSWEDMAVEESCIETGSSQEQPPLAGGTESMVDENSCWNEDMQESTPSELNPGLCGGGKLEVKSSASDKGGMDAASASLSVSGGGANGHYVSGTSRKNLSPCLSKSSKMDSVSSKTGQFSQAPPKSKEEKENLNVIFIGHVDAGKSTIGGHIMYLTGQVDKRTLEKYEREAREKNRETWYLSWALDTNQEEREKGKTVELGRASFESDKKRFTILDAPGHAGFVPNMIGGAAQADVGVLVISARKGEFETGFERKGQTREHAMLAKTAGVKHLVILVNKMDDPTVQWLEERYDECKTKLTPFLKKVGFNPKTDLFFMPVSGLTGANLKETATKECPWYHGPSFISYLDSLSPVVREDNGIFRMPIADKYKDMGTLVMGKLESGSVMKGSSLLLMPNKVPVEVLQIIRVEAEVGAAYSGDNIKLRLKGVEEEDISTGFVLCDPASPCNMSQVFVAQIVILEHKSIICAGYNAVLHIHTVVEEVQIMELKALIDRKTGKRSARSPRFVKQDQIVIATLQTNGVICVESFKDFPQMARFTLRDEGKTIAIGKVLHVLNK